MYLLQTFKQCFSKAWYPEQDTFIPSCDIVQPRMSWLLFRLRPCYCDCVIPGSASGALCVGVVTAEDLCVGLQWESTCQVSQEWSLRLPRSSNNLVRILTCRKQVRRVEVLKRKWTSSSHLHQVSAYLSLCRFAGKDKAGWSVNACPTPSTPLPGYCACTSTQHATHTTAYSPPQPRGIPEITWNSVPRCAL